MATVHCLAEIEPLDPVTGSRVTVRVASANLSAITVLNGVVWEPAMSKRPTTAIRFFEGDFSTPASSASASLAIRKAGPRLTVANFDRLNWSGAELRIYAGLAGASWPWQQVFAGRVRSFDGGPAELRLAAEVDTEPFEADLLTTTYAGDGDEEGGEDLKGQTKPLALGWPMNVEPVLIDATNNVYQFSAYGPIEEVTTLYERASSFGDPVDDYADFAALVAADIDPGQWGTCLDEGLIRLGAPAYGVITGDLKGHAVSGTAPRLTGEIIALLADMSGIDSGLIVQDTLDDMDTLKPWPIDVVLRSQVRFIDLARQLALPLNYQAAIGLTGNFFVTRPDLAASPALTLDGLGRRIPPVRKVEEKSTSAPYHRIVFGAARNWRVHTPDEIANYEDFDDIAGPDETVVQCDWQGAPKANQVDPRYVQFQLWQNGIDRTADATWGRTIDSGAVDDDDTLDDPASKGRLNITQADSDGRLTVTATLGNVTKSKQHRITRSLDAQPLPGGVGGGGTAPTSTAISGSSSSATMVGLGQEIEPVAGAGGIIDLSASYTFYTYGGGSTLRAWMQIYEYNGSIWVPIGSEVQCTTDAEIVAGPYSVAFIPGEGAVNYSRTGLTAGNAYRYQPYIRLSGATPGYLSGTFGGVGR